VSAAAQPPAASATAPRGAYRRHQPETTALYEVVRGNLETLYGAIEDGAIAVRIPQHARKELEAYLARGRLCRGFARLRCQECGESLLVAFNCKGRGFCPSCMGRRMCATAANLIERVLPETGLRQWVLTFPFSWRRRLAQDGALLGSLSVPPPRFHTVRYAGGAAPAEETRRRKAAKQGTRAWSVRGVARSARVPQDRRDVVVAEPEQRRAGPRSGGEAPGKAPTRRPRGRDVDGRIELVQPSADLRPQPMRGSAPGPVSASGSRPE
jgi:hypothetical protein